MQHTLGGVPWYNVTHLFPGTKASAITSLVDSKKMLDDSEKNTANNSKGTQWSLEEVKEQAEC